MFDLSGKTALVTGATGGIGGAVARALHKCGAKVVLSGTLTPGGFHATGMTAKCPSKYEPQLGSAAGTTGAGTN